MPLPLCLYKIDIAMLSN